MRSARPLRPGRQWPRRVGRPRGPARPGRLECQLTPSRGRADPCGMCRAIAPKVVTWNT